MPQNNGQFRPLREVCLRDCITTGCPRKGPQHVTIRVMLLHAHDLTHAYGARVLFQHVNVQIPPKARIGLVGPNGSGKTTLLRLLLGLEEPTAGRVHRAKGLRIGYLPQHADRPPAEQTLADLLDRSFTRLRDLEARMRDLEQRMAHEASPRLLQRYGRLQTEYESLGGYTYRARRARILAGLGFSEEDLPRPLRSFSGGQRTRAHLARLLLEEPDLLVLDEPTNHLDLNGVAFLESYLQKFPGAVLVVAHDRYFLDQVVRTIWELGPHGIEVYQAPSSGGKSAAYTAYVQQRAQRWHERRRIWQATLERLQRDLVYIQRNMAGQASAQAKGRLKRLSRVIQALETGGLAALDALGRGSWARVVERWHLQTRDLSVAEAAARLKALRFPQEEPPTPRPRLSLAHRSGDWVLRARDLVVGYPGRPLVRVARLDLRRGQCAALLGPNGSGKTTFLRTILGQVQPLAGSIRLGEGVRLGYLAQAAADLQPQRTVLDELLAAVPSLLPAEARQHLARYLFRGDAVHKAVGLLSGGERARLALAKLALQGTNFLLLDEPTNHLDIPSQEALQAVLAAYPGTILLVSHDRYLVQALATQIWYLEQGRLQVFAGSYEAFMAQHASQSAHAAEEKGSPRATATRAGRSPAPRQRSGLSKNERRKLERRLATLEARIAALEAEQADLERQLSAPPRDPAQVRALSEHYAEVQRALERLLADWEDLCQRLEEGKGKLGV